MKRTNRLRAPIQTLEQIAVTVLSAWLMSSAVMNLVHRRTADYFSLSYAGLSGTLPLLLLFLGLTGLLLWTAPALDEYVGADPYSRILYLSWLIFSTGVLWRLDYEIPSVTHLMVNLTAFILAREIHRSSWNGGPLGDRILTLAGGLLLIRNVWVVPWSGLGESLANYLGVETGILFPLLLAWLGLAVIFGVLLARRRILPRTAGAVWGVAAAVFLIQAILLGRILYARVESLSTPTYDFNLFAQMFHNLAETLQPVTTLERNMPLSHFKVHLSPIYYLLLPFYLVFRSPAALNVFQAMVVASGVFPLVLILRQRQLNRMIQGILCGVFLVSTPLITSNFYDLHENCFLVPILLWLIWFIEKRSNLGLAVMTLLTLSVKEDAVIYLWALAAFMILDRRMVRQGLAMLGVSGLYFMGAVRYLNEFGDGAMTDRFHSLISVPQWSLLSVPFAVWRNPGFILSQIYREDKLPYLIQMLAPLGFLPLLTRRLSRWVLLVPFLLMNLMVDYQYQFDIRFQYNYGSYILLFYLAILFLSDQDSLTTPEPASLKPSRLTGLLLAGALASGYLFSGLHLLDYEQYPALLRTEAASLSVMKEALAEIPDSASVLASDFLTGALSQRKELYDLSYNVTPTGYFPADYIVVDLRPVYKGDHEKLVPRFLTDGYVIKTQLDQQLLILKSPTAGD